MMNKKGQQYIFGLTIILVLVGLVVMIMGFDYVPAGTIGVKDKFGEINNVPWGPGMKWTGIFTSTRQFSTRIQLREYDASAASKDLQIVFTKIALNFRVDSSQTPEIYKTIGMQYQDIIITPVIQEAVKSSTAKYTAEDLVKEREAVKFDITNYITNRLRDKDLIVTEVSITDFQFSEEFNNAIEQKQVAEQEALTAENRYNEMLWTSKAMGLQKEVLEIKKLDLQREWINQWDGKLPLIMSGESNGMFMQFDFDSLQEVTELEETEI